MILLDAGLERYERIPVVTDNSEPRCVFLMELPQRPRLGEHWYVQFEMHVTNDDLRARGYGVAAVTEVRIENDADNNRSGFSWVRLSGSWNVGVEAHHALLARNKLLYWNETTLAALPEGDPLYVKAYLMAKSTQANGGDRLEITPGRGFMQLMICEVLA